MLINLIADAIYIQTTINNIIINIINALWMVGILNFDKQYCQVQ